MQSKQLRNVEIVDEYQDNPNPTGKYAIYAECPYCDTDVRFTFDKHHYHDNRCYSCGAHFTTEEAYFPEPAYAYLFE